MPPSPSSCSATFFRDELHIALKEQHFGIASFTLGGSSAFDATARIELLEKVEINIMLSLRGYQVIALDFFCLVSHAESNGRSRSLHRVEILERIPAPILRRLMRYSSMLARYMRLGAQRPSSTDYRVNQNSPLATL
jgi:hypothetical protein